MHQVSRIKHRACARFAIIAAGALSAAACDAGPDGPEEDAEVDDTEGRRSPLNGTVTFPDSSCDAYKADIRDAMELASANLSSAAMTACVRDAILSYNDSFPELVLGQMRQNLPTAVRCANLDPGVAAHAPVGISNETLTIDKGYADGAGAAELAAIILHEVAHNKGYEHPNPDNSSPSLFYASAQEYGYTVNEQIRACSRSISAGSSPALPNGPRRGGLPSETTLAPAGKSGGRAFALGCPAGKLPKGVFGRAGTKVDAFGLDCAAPGAGVSSQTTSVGGTGGDPYDLRCGAGEVLVGLYGRANDVNEAVGAICANESDVLAGGVATRKAGSAGGTGGVSYVRQCPKRMFVRGVHGKSATLVDRLEVDCQRLDDVESVQRSFPPRVGGTGGSLTWEECAGRAALVGLTHQTGALVDRLGGTCAAVTSACSGAACTEGVSGLGYQLPAHGGTGGEVGQERCAPGSALVGLRFRAATYVDAIGGVCAPVASWTSASGAVSTTNLPLHGGSGGTTATRTCPRGELLTGWLIATSGNVESVQPICRTFN